MNAATIDPTTLLAEANRIRSLGALGASGQLPRLFDYLVSRTLSDTPPKEIEIAVDVLKRSPDFDAAQDSSVRVYVHKLRRRLDDFYAEGVGEPALRLTIPKGEYRLSLEAQPVVASAFTPDTVSAGVCRQALARRGLLALLAASVLVNIVVLLLFFRQDDDSAQLNAIGKQPIWAPLLDDDLPVTVVVGDYYIFGESAADGSVRRLVREFDINSREDLYRYFAADPGTRGNYHDMALGYLPTSTAFALRELIPILSAKHRRLDVVLASNMTSEMLRSGHVVYIGYLSGMGMLQDLVFAASRFAPGDSYDELVDLTSNHVFVSQAAAAAEGHGTYRDYGLLSTFSGPGGNRLVIVAGTRDIALMEAAHMLTKPQRLAELQAQVPASASFEALYEVSGIRGVNLASKLIRASALDDDAIWRNPDTPESVAN